MATEQDEQKALTALLGAQSESIAATINAILQMLESLAAAGGGRGPGVPPRHEDLLASAEETKEAIQRFIRVLRGDVAAPGRGNNVGPR